MRTGFYAGSFDPPTNGHADIIARAARMFDRLIIGIGRNKDKNGFLPLAVREQLLQQVIADLSLPSSHVKVLSFEGLTVEAARKLGASCFVRGLRNGHDFDYETQTASMNKTLAPDIETVLLVTKPEYSMISSSLVRQIASMGGDISSFVPQACVKAVQQAINSSLT